MRRTILTWHDGQPLDGTADHEEILVCMPGGSGAREFVEVYEWIEGEGINAAGEVLGEVLRWAHLPGENVGSDPALNQTLAGLGLAHRLAGTGESPHGRQEIVAGGAVLFTGTAAETWAWLRATG